MARQEKEVRKDYETLGYLNSKSSVIHKLASHDRRCISGFLLAIKLWKWHHKSGHGFLESDMRASVRAGVICSRKH